LQEPPADRLWFAQALRALACLLVVAEHYSAAFLVVHEGVARLALFPPLTGLPFPSYLRIVGWLFNHHVLPSTFGVALFFLVSGFVIPFSLQRNSLGGFFIRRFFRLYPTLWMVQILLLIVLARQAHRYHLDFPHTPGTVASNALLLSSYLGHSLIEAVCWTLLVEELFYAICAVCAWRRVLHRPSTVLVIAVMLTGLALACPGIPPAADAPLWRTALYWLGRNATFVVFIFVGVVLHYLYRRTWRLRLGLPLILILLGLFALCCWRGSVGQAGLGALYLVSALVALVVFAVLLVVNRWLPYSRWLDRLAEISYPLYLVHATLGYIAIRTVYLRTGSHYLGIAGAFVVAVVLAALLHRFVERPGNDLGRRLVARLASRTAGTAAPVRRAA
jgi:peptidoglycan/LPS O-acetylase OafA/YrhL